MKHSLFFHAEGAQRQRKRSQFNRPFIMQWQFVHLQPVESFEIKG